MEKIPSNNSRSPSSSIWKNIKVGTNARVLVRPISMETIARMPEGTQTFIERGPIELTIATLKKILAGSYPDSPE